METMERVLRAARRAAEAGSGSRVEIQPDCVLIELRRGPIGITRRILWSEVETARFDVISYVMDGMDDTLKAHKEDR